MTLKLHRIGFYVEVEHPGLDMTDALHRVEEALGLEEGREVVHEVSAQRGGTTRGRIVKARALHGHEVPPAEE